MSELVPVRQPFITDGDDHVTTTDVAEAARRFIARKVETRIGRALLTDAIPDSATIRVHRPTRRHPRRALHQYRGGTGDAPHDGHADDQMCTRYATG